MARGGRLGKVDLTRSLSGEDAELDKTVVEKIGNFSLVHVPYKGGGPMSSDLLGGHIDLAVGSVALLSPQVAGGRMLARHDGSPAAPASLVNFEQVYSLPRGILEAAASKAKPRLRLLPPYREHVSLAFGRYFTRVGLFQDIPRYAT